MFGFKKVEREIYNSTFLRKVLINIHFPSIEQISDKSDFIKGLFISEFPRVIVGKNRGYQISIGNKDKNPNFKAIDENEAVSLKSEDGQLELIVNRDSISYSIEGVTYKCFEDDIQKIINKFVNLFEVIGVTQILSCNLRKINLIEFGYGDSNIPNGILQAMLNKAVVYNDDAFPNMAKIGQNIHNIEFKEEDYSLNLRYGMNTLPLTDKNIGQLIVDYNIQSNVSLKYNLIPDEIKVLNNELYNVFSWIFNESAKQILRNGISK
ncbi:MAG TPA: TIGR04255 family protein [Saprospiraceae bacterium]|nr:TIGR04255 family protein [Saprospiraceae bacterium]HMU04196.1 TIGR04255 family protein [Saprospiraceae bacterium]